MRISTITRYGVRAMIDLAIHGKDGYVYLKDIARRQQISLRYLENIMTKLVKAGLVFSSRGRNGGFSLSRPPSMINVSEIIRVLEGSFAPVPCVDNPYVCERSDFCVSHELWKGINSTIWEYFSSHTLEELAKKEKEKFVKIKIKRRI